MNIPKIAKQIIRAPFHALGLDLVRRKSASDGEDLGTIVCLEAKIYSDHWLVGCWSGLSWMWELTWGNLPSECLSFCQKQSRYVSSRFKNRLTSSPLGLGEMQGFALFNARWANNLGSLK